MKQTIKNFGKALLGLVMPIKHQPLSDGWLKQNDKEIKDSVKSSAFRPPHFKKYNTTVKNEFKPDGVVSKTNSKCIELDTRESIIQDHRETNLFGGFDNNIKEDLAKEISKDKLTTEQKLKQALSDLGSQPGYGKFEKSTDKIIKCDVLGTYFFPEEIFYYAPSNLHISAKYLKECTKEQLQDYFDIDNDDEFRGWLADKLLKVREF